MLRLSGLSPWLISIFCDIFCLSHAINYSVTHGGLSINPICLDEDMLLIQHDLLDSPHIVESSVADACRLGALLYMKTITRPMWTVLRTSGALVGRLQASLDTIDSESTATPLLIWLLFMGGITCGCRTSERTWFVEKLASVIASLSEELSDWASVRRTLKTVLWVDSLHDGLGQALWHETGTSRAQC